MRKTSSNGPVRAAHAYELVQAVAQHEKRKVEEILSDPQLEEEVVNWQDPLGWIPLTYAAFYGDYELVKQLLRLGAIVNHLSVSRQGSTADGTTPLHACAVMKFEGQVASDHYLESARVLMLSGGNPYQENASGLTPIEVAGNQGNVSMKLLLESSALFKGTLAFKIPRMLGDKTKDRYCLVAPRFPWFEDGQVGPSMSSGRPTFSMTCYKAAEESQPVTIIPLDNARVVVETGVFTESGILFVKTSPKLLKNIALKEVQSNQCVIGVRARANGTQTASLVMQTLVEVLKTMNAASVTGSSGQLCEAAMGQAMHNQGLIGSLLPYPGSTNEEEQLQPRQKSRSSRRIMMDENMPDSIPEEGEDPKERRKSLSISSLRKGLMRRISIGDKPRRQSFALGQEKERDKPRVQSIREELPDKSNHKPSGEISRVRQSLSLFRRRKSIQLDDGIGRPSESKSIAATTIKTMPERNSVPVDFFGPYREELLQRYGLDRRQISSRELPISLANSPTRRSLDVGDFDDPVLPVQRASSQSREASMPIVPSALQTSEWVGRPSQDGSSHERPRRHPSTSDKPPTPQPPSRQSSSRQRQSRELQREEPPPPELSPTTPPLTQKAVRTASRRNSRSTTPAATPRSSHQAVDGTPRNSLSSRPPTELPDSMAEEVMARLARRLPDVNLNVRTANNRSVRSRSSVKAPPPARSRRFSNKEMFGLGCGQDELFQWSLRPERSTRGFTPPPKIQPKKVETEREAEAASPDASTSTQNPVAGAAGAGQQLTEENVAELTQSGWIKNDAAASGAEPSTETPATPVGALQDPSGGALPSLPSEVKASDGVDPQELPNGSAAEDLPPEEGVNGIQEAEAESTENTPALQGGSQLKDFLASEEKQAGNATLPQDLDESAAEQDRQPVQY